jgi:hypothetical protein
VCDGRYHVADGDIPDEAAQPESVRAGAREKLRRAALAGAIRQSCPRPMVEAALNHSRLSDGNASRVDIFAVPEQGSGSAAPGAGSSSTGARPELR